MAAITIRVEGSYASWRDFRFIQNGEIFAFVKKTMSLVTILLFENYLLESTKLETDNDTNSWSHFQADTDSS